MDQQVHEVKVHIWNLEMPPNRPTIQVGKPIHQHGQSPYSLILLISKPLHSLPPFLPFGVLISQVLI